MQENINFAIKSDFSLGKKTILLTQKALANITFIFPLFYFVSESEVVKGLPGQLLQPHSSSSHSLSLWCLQRSLPSERNKPISLILIFLLVLS